jgi:Protein of unknown function (DUF3987)
VRNSPLRASDAHIAIVGHITKDELLRYLNATELANGFFNRFLLIGVRRSKLLPFGGTLNGTALDGLHRRLAAALNAAREDRELTFTIEARARYAAIYERLSAGRPGLFGVATGRAEAHTIRLALIYALLDSATAIDLPYLEAALEVWRYAYDQHSMGVRRHARGPHR